MKLEDLFPGSFTAENFIDGPATLTIKAITPITFDEDGEARQKGKVTFEETSNYWVMGKEAAGVLAAELGSDDTDDWIGHQVALRRDQTRYKGKMVPCIRGSFADAKEDRPKPKRGKPVRAISAARERSEEDEDPDALEARVAAARARKAKVTA